MFKKHLVECSIILYLKCYKLGSKPKRCLLFCWGGGREEARILPALAKTSRWRAFLHAFQEAARVDPLPIPTSPAAGDCQQQLWSKGGRVRPCVMWVPPRLLVRSSGGAPYPQFLAHPKSGGSFVLWFLAAGVKRLGWRRAPTAIQPLL